MTKAEVTAAAVTVLAALAKGENDSRLLDGRDFDSAEWVEARVALSALAAACGPESEGR